MADATTGAPAPLLVVYLNGADGRVVSDLMAAGRLPALAALRGRGASVRMDVPGDLVTECAWASLLTGHPPGDFALVFPGWIPETLSLSFSREPAATREPWWLGLPDRGRGALVFDPPDFHPHPASQADEVCGWNVLEPPHDPFFTNGSLRRRLPSSAPPLRDPPRPRSSTEERAVSKAFCASAALRGSAALALCDGRTTACIGFHELHAVVHNFGHHYVESHWARPSDPEPELVTRPYEAVDAALAALVERFRGANVVVVGALGIRPGNRAGHLLEELLARAGLLVRASAQPQRSGEPSRRAPASALAVPRAWRENLGSRLPLRVRHGLAIRRFRSRYVWSGTRVFPLPAWTMGHLRVNLAGRESAGVVPERELDGLLTTATDLILAARDPDTGRPLASRVLRMQEVFRGVRASLYPDLLVEWAGDRPALRATHPVLGSWEADLGPGHLYTEHAPGGFAFAAGPGVRALREDLHADPLGLAPTLLALKGLPPRPSMPGEPWTDVLDG